MFMITTNIPSHILTNARGSMLYSWMYKNGAELVKSFFQNPWVSQSIRKYFNCRMNNVLMHLLEELGNQFCLFLAEAGWLSLLYLVCVLCQYAYLIKLKTWPPLLPHCLHTFMTNSIQYPGSCDYIIRIISQLVRCWHNSRDNVSSCHGVELLIRIKISVTFSTIKS